MEVKDESASAHEAGMVAPVISHVPEFSSLLMFVFYVMYHAYLEKGDGDVFLGAMQYFFLFKYSV